MKEFTYDNYLYYRKFLNNNNTFECILKEKNYSYNEKRFHQPHDKIFKEILDEKTEAVKFLNEMLKLKNTKYKLEIDNIEKYNRKFITDDFSNMESDVIYKKTDQNIFFLIEHQSTVDYSMPYRILKYNMAIMQSAIDKRKVKNKNYKMPTIYSFVIYTGKRKWNVSNYLTDKQEKLAGCKIKSFANFKLIDINEYTEKELLESESLLTKIMLLEKAKNYEELEDYLQNILKRKINEHQVLFFQKIIKYVFKNKLNNNELKKYMQKLEEKQRKGGNIMFVDIMVKKFEEVFEIEEKNKKQEKEFKKRETKIKEQETKIKEQETKVKEQETKVKERENKIEAKEAKIEQERLKIKEREQAVTIAENEMIIKMLKNNIDENTIIKIINIDRNRLSKIKQDNNLAIIN